ncbi:MAG TPA: ribulose-phosphate 3-epimerase [Chloroflexota bacterium]|nr:ribulose-phosphate 3-epimerase [Chloroflexota bacterium]
MKLAPSILTADWSRLGEQIRAAEEAGVDYIHLDVMDGHFVPNISFGPLVVAAVRQLTTLPLDVHLMIERPELYVDDFARAGATIITVQQEACIHLHRQVEQIKELGCQASVALNPATPLVMLEDTLPDLDQVLVMTVNPGFGGQAFIPQMLDKVRRMRAMLDAAGSSADLEVDGGIKPDNVAQLIVAGATVVVAGSAIFSPQRSVAEAVRLLRDAAGSRR